MQDLKRLSGVLITRWRSLDAGRRLLLGCLLIGVVGTVIISFFLVRHVTYAILYTGLEPEQASGVVEELRDMKVPFRLTDSGRTIQVPEREVYTVRLDLAGKGVPDGGNGGYEIFDHSRFGMTNFMQHVNYRRALEGELTRTIREMDGVVAARIHLNIPERTLFVDESRQPSASVMLRLRPGAHLTRSQVEGIAYLVAGSVEGLGTENVNVLDYHGRLLSQHSDQDGLNSQGTARLEMESAVSRLLEEKAQTLLDRVVGPGNSVVRVAAELDFERLERDVEVFDPDNAVVRSEELNENADGENGEQRSSVTNYEINRTVERLVRVPGNVTRLTVAVTVDGHYEEQEGDKGEPIFAVRSDEEIAQLGLAVKNAVGVNEERGDQFHISCVQFEGGSLESDQEDVQSLERHFLWENLLSKGFMVLVALGILVFLRKFLLTALRTLSETRNSAVTTTSVTPEVGGSDAPNTPAKPLSSRVSELTRSQPKESAAMILNMVGEDR